MSEFFTGEMRDAIESIRIMRMKTEMLEDQLLNAFRLAGKGGENATVEDFWIWWVKFLDWERENASPEVVG